MTLLRAENLTKSYPGVVALKDVSIAVEPGHVHCIVGENGAGKSTLVKTLTGLVTPDSGRLIVCDEDTTGRASSAIAYVPQELNLFDNMTVAENIFLPAGAGGGRSRFFDPRRCNAAALPVMQRLRMSCQPGDLARDITVAERQLLQIARALAVDDFKVLILDEPTAALTRPEIGRLFAVIGELTAQGRSVIFITHRLDEVLHLHSAITVLRNGEVVGHVDKTSNEIIDEAWIVRAMTGKGIDLGHLWRPRQPRGERLMEVRGLSGKGFRDISFDLHEGEVLGFAGLVGAGRSEIAQTIFGFLRGGSGEVRYRGQPWRLGDPRRAIANGVIYLSEERKSHGIFANLPVRENVGIGLLHRLSKGGIVSPARERATTLQIVADYNVRTASTETRIRNLSGGNQQKILIGRGLMAGPRIMFLDEPTRGIDVGAKADVYALIRRIAEEERMGIVLISSEMEEILRCCNRVVALYDGSVSAEIGEDELDMATVLAAIMDAGPARGDKRGATGRPQDDIAAARGLAV